MLAMLVHSAIVTLLFESAMVTCSGKCRLSGSNVFDSCYFCLAVARTNHMTVFCLSAVCGVL